ncbi:MAG TPA: hypothetical protein VMZ31_06850 [Phycisphaerae bacterium]|nr:hypothetical protein [Phycisphaerae bacterium]
MKKTRRWAICLASCTVALGAMWAAGRSAALPADAPSGTQRQTFDVLDIRFGVVDPPVIAQRDISIRTATSNQRLEPKPLECSGMAWIGDAFLVTSDRHGHALFTVPFNVETCQIGEPQVRPVIGNEEKILDDAESVTVRPALDGGYVVYVSCSLSNDRSELPLPKRRHMLRCHIGPDGNPTRPQAVVMEGGHLRQRLQQEFDTLGVQPYRAFYGEFPGPNKNTYRWGNVEGITFTPNADTLLCGMRNPMPADCAMLFAIANVDRAFDAEDPSLLEVTDLFVLDLGERGIADICWDPVTQGYLIVAGRSAGPKLDKDQPYPPNWLDSALFWWSGRKSDAPVLFAKAPDMKIEAICRLGDTGFIAIGSDEGDVSEGREQRQSVLTILYFTGLVEARASTDG